MVTCLALAQEDTGDFQEYPEHTGYTSYGYEVNPKTDIAFLWPLVNPILCSNGTSCRIRRLFVVDEKTDRDKPMAPQFMSLTQTRDIRFDR